MSLSASERRVQAETADKIDKAIHARLRTMREEGLIGNAAFYRASQAVVEVTAELR